jgi:hypothetical protein
MIGPVLDDLTHIKWYEYLYVIFTNQDQPFDSEGGRLIKYSELQKSLKYKIFMCPYFRILEISNLYTLTFKYLNQGLD